MEHSLLGQLAERSGVAEADVEKVLDTLGFSRLTSATALGEGATDQITPDGIRLSVRVADGVLAV